MRECSSINNTSQIFNFSYTSIYKIFNENMSMVNANIKHRIRNSIRDAVFGSPEIFGHLDSSLTHKVTKVIDTWTNNINIISTTGRSPDPLLSISVGILREPYNDLPYEFLGFSTIEWLRWLMLGADRTIATYNFVKDDGRGRHAISMQRKGRSWTIPPEHRGQHNLALHLFPQIEKNIDAIVKSEVGNTIKPPRHGSTSMYSIQQKGI
tara:strand:- start:38 stop:664 length:627 start_codon:yes stop_codon:yes gene_type:complete